jgi:pimeloyl-ACP methyl ester carboxylesterase
MAAIQNLVLDASSTRFSALAAGDPRAPWVLCLHGIPASAEIWREVLPALAHAGWYAIAPDLAGFGATTYGAAAATSLTSNADALCQWLEQAHPEPVWWVGHDLGGAVTQLALVRHPTRVGRVTLCNSPWQRSWPVPAVRQLRAVARLGLVPLMAKLGLLSRTANTRALERAFGDRSRLTPALVSRVFWDSKVAAGSRAFGHFAAQLDENDFATQTEHLNERRVPAQLVWGMADRHQPWASVGTKLEAALGKPRVDRLEGVGHFVPIEAPDALVAALVGFGTSRAAV